MHIPLGFCGTLGVCMVCSLVKTIFFVYCVIQSTVDRAPRRYLYTRMRLRVWLQKVRKVKSVYVSSFLQVGRSLQARSQVLRFGGENTFLGDNIFLFVICLRQIGHN